MLNNIKKFVKKNIANRYWNRVGHFSYFKQKVFFPQDSVIFKRAIEEGTFENENVNLIIDLIKSDTVFLDIGANIGLMSIPILHIKKNIKVISVEASPSSASYLRRTNEIHQDKLRWTIINKAVLEFEGMVDFHVASDSDSAFDSIRDTKRIKFIDKISIPCTTIDKIWQDEEKPEVSFIKIDIEGADLLALKGAKTCINSCKPFILMEWNRTNIIPFELDNSDLMNFVKEMDYNLYALPKLNRIDSITDINLFCQLGENFLLVPSDVNKQ